MDVLHSLMLGFSVALTPTNIFYAFFGCIVGTLIGVLPGIGPLCTIALILPTTFSMNPTSAMIMMCAVYYGAQYGGSTTSILINVPGESASVMTCWTDIRWRGTGGQAWPWPYRRHLVFRLRDPERHRADAHGPPPGKIRP